MPKCTACPVIGRMTHCSRCKKTHCTFCTLPYQLPDQPVCRTCDNACRQCLTPFKKKHPFTCTHCAAPICIHCAHNYHTKVYCTSCVNILFTHCHACPAPDTWFCHQCNCKYCDKCFWNSHPCRRPSDIPAFIKTYFL